MKPLSESHLTENKAREDNKAKEDYPLRTDLIFSYVLALEKKEW